ncbi:MAG: amino-acid N-acetyltransferase [Nitrosomonas sp.]|nr:amino-acid N-acetyltransferase [Nitrosomonas sp.]MDP1951775.1 amino-acid N-acetyltransferase [Nitrosomonas sp.]
MSTQKMKLNTDFVTWFRSVAPYVNAFRSKTFVIAFSGKMVADKKFVELVHDFNLLASLGVRLALVHGARPQIEARLEELKLQTKFVNGILVTDPATLQYVKETVGRVHIEIEALLSMGLPNSPMANAAIRLTSGNFVTACPIGVIDGVDLMHAGKVRKINAAAIRTRLEIGEVVLISPLGYSPTGEIFNLTLENVATEVAIALDAEKLIFLTDYINTKEIPTNDPSSLLRELTIAQCKPILQELSNNDTKEAVEIKRYLPCAIKACEANVARTHLVNRHIDGAILQELFTHNGIGCMISQVPLQTLRKAKIEDIGGILQLIEPLEVEGILVRRNRELLEIEIDRFIILEHDGTIVGCAALYPFANERACELACLAVHPNYRNAGHGSTLLKHVETKIISQGTQNLFVLTTSATHWFIEHGFKEVTLSELPQEKLGLYNYQRRSKVLLKSL